MSHTQRVHVAGEERLTLELLGRHVRQAADDGRAVGGDLEEAGCAEVGDLDDPVLADEHIGRPEVAVQDVLSMRVIQRVRDLAGVVERPGQFEGLVALDDGFERLARQDLITMKKTASCRSARMVTMSAMVERGEETRLLSSSPSSRSSGRGTLIATFSSIQVSSAIRPHRSHRSRLSTESLLPTI